MYEATWGLLIGVNAQSISYILWKGMTPIRNTTLVHRPILDSKSATICFETVIK